LDADGNQHTTALEDGILALRFIFGYTDPLLTMGAVGAGCVRCDGGSIGSYLSWLGDRLDIDDDGDVLPLTDGILIQRYLFGMRGDALVASSVGIRCGR